MDEPITAERLAAVLADHKAWLAGQGGRRADLRGADLRDADLRKAARAEHLDVLPKTVPA